MQRPLAAILSDIHRRHPDVSSMSETPVLDAINCPTCRDAGRIRLDRPLGHPDFGRSVLCPECSPREAPAIVLDRAGLPLIMAAATLDSWRPADALQAKMLLALRDWATDWPPHSAVVLLSGTVGTGKTHLACGLLRAAYERHGVRGVFRHVVELVDDYRRASRGEPGDEDRVDAGVLRAPLLVLDDYGAERTTDLALERVYRVVDVRYRGRLPTVITTNVDPDALEARVYSRIASGLVVRLTGPDRRLT